MDDTQTVITPALSAFIEDLMEKSGVPGLTLAVVRPDGVAETRAWGKRSEANDPATPDTLFSIASCSKAFLAASVGILLDDHASGRVPSTVPLRLDWDTKLRDALGEDFALMDPWADAKADLRDALSHVTGVTGHELAMIPKDTPVDVVRRMRHLRPAHELRKRFSYANHMYVVVSHLISRYSGMPYTEFVRKRIFEPLGMNTTTYDASSNPEKMTQAWSNGGRRVPPLLIGKESELAAAPGGVISTANDLAKWVKMLLARGVNPETNKAIISPATFDVITTPLQIASLPLGPDLGIVTYGMGWFKGSYEGRVVLAHPGAIRGFGSLVNLFPNDGLGVAIAINTDETYNIPETVAYYIANNVLGLTGGKDLKERIGRIATAPTPQTTKAPLPLTAYAGTYTNVGYGSITLCTPSTDTDGTPSNSEHCSRVFSDFKAVQEHPEAPLPPALYAVWSRVWATHARLTYPSPGTSNDTDMARHAFKFTPETHFPSGYGADTSPFLLRRESSDRLAAEFVLEEGKVVGFGMFYVGLVTTLPERKEGSVRDRALVWFERV